ncbi:DNA replication/repair protein RecF [Chryseosolibacter indicus]|uniref:DNA replication and repair protein RecF n=1 Tax=Chryseosolibacter indicus TaxID=2782351 RepID=A0ABS5VKZ6_9BACT|nr:DNA replication/repair protein RecF [Chryseosolibacter indicus]MBT1702051.1 DNA replication/repair protein RecF [Chryseosolibacter indicus]
MQIQTLQLINFKNYAEARLDLSEKINVLVGKNGSGKTNLLDAIHFLSLTKSAFTSADNYCIKQGEQFFSIKSTFSRGNTHHELLCAVQSGAKKVFREDANDYPKLSDHIGKYPVVLIAPDDTALVKEGSEERRKFFDSMISQLDKAYLEALIQYTYAIKQRNSLLKMFADTHSFDGLALESYDRMLVRSGNTLYNKRAAFVGEFVTVFKRYYDFIVDNEEVDLRYNSELKNTSFEDGLLKNKQRDLYLQRTSFGVHRDDYQFTLGTGDLKRLGSQGQQKSFIIALKLAQFEIIKNAKGIKPILLLDDIFDKLDDARIGKLLELIRNEEFGQLFITDARPDRTAALLDQIHVSATMFNVDNGSIRKL